APARAQPLRSAMGAHARLVRRIRPPRRHPAREVTQALQSRMEDQPDRTHQPALARLVPDTAPCRAPNTPSHSRITGSSAQGRGGPMSEWKPPRPANSKRFAARMFLPAEAHPRQEVSMTSDRITNDFAHLRHAALIHSKQTRADIFLLQNTIR